MDLATIGFKADTSGLLKAERGLDDLAKQGAKTDRAVSSSMAGVSKGFSAAAAAVGGLVSTTAALSKLVSVTREFDVLNAGLITATGSAKEAATAFKAIEDFETTTPYSLAQATRAFTQLVNLGLTPSEKALTSYGNTAAAMGKDLSQMVEAVADATVGEFERLKEFGIKASSEGDRVSFTFRGMTTTVRKSAAEIEGYLMGLGNNEFAGAMANRMNTLDGAISNLEGSWDGLFRTVSKAGTGDLIESSVRAATDAITELSKAIGSGQIGDYIDAVLGKFSGFGLAIEAILEEVGKLFTNAGKFWYIDMAKSADLIIDAFVSLPENIKAFLQLATVEVAAYVDRLVIYGKMAANAINPLTAVYDPTADFEKTNNARAAMIQKIMDERQASIDTFKAQIDGADKVRAAYDEQAKSLDSGIDRLGKYKAAVADVGPAASKTAAELKKLQEIQEGWDLYWYDEIEKGLEEMDKIAEDNANAYYDYVERGIEAIDSQKAAVTGLAAVSEKAAERIEAAFADAWMNAFDGFESVVDGMKNAFKRLLAEMAHMALTKPIMLQIGNMLPAGGLADIFKAQGAGASTSAFGDIGKMLGLSSGTQGMIGNIASFAGPAALIYSAGKALSEALGGNGKIGGLLGGLTGGVFGGGWKTESNMLNLSLAGGDITGTETTTNVKKKLFKNRRETFTDAFDASSIDSAFDAISAALASSAKTFGITGADEIIKGFASSVNIDIKGKTEEEVQAAISQWISSTTDSLVSAVFGDSLDGLQREGEGVIDTVNRLSMNMNAVKSITDSLGLGFDLTGKAAMVAATNIVDLAGGIDQLSALTTQYYQSFYSETERQLMLQQQLAEQFAAINTTMPTTREGFRALVDAIDLTTAAGQAQFAALMQLVPGMDQYLQALEAQRSASEAAAEAAQKEAEAKAAALKQQGLDLQVRLYDALGKSAEALALRRQMEIEATDESLRAMLLSIYAAEDAATAQRELASAQEAAASSARDAAAAALDAAQNAFGKLQDSAQAEKDRLATELDLKLSAIDKEREALESQRDSVIAGYESQSRAVEQYVDKLEGLSGVINDFLGSTGAAVDPFKRLTQIFNEARAGLLPDQSELQSVLGAIGSGGGSFNSAFEQQRAMAVARNQAAGIGGIVGGQLAGAKSQVALIQQQIVDANAYYDEQLLKLDQAAEQAQKLHDEQVAEIDKQLSEAQKQLNALLGIDDRMLTMSEALAEFYASLEKAQSLQVETGVEQIAAINRVESAILQVGQQIVDIAKPEDRVWVPPTMPTMFTNEGQPVTREMLDLLKEINAGMEATAKHTKTSADALELTQFEAAEANP